MLLLINFGYVKVLKSQKKLHSNKHTVTWQKWKLLIHNRIYICWVINFSFCLLCELCCAYTSKGGKKISKKIILVGFILWHCLVKREDTVDVKIIRPDASSGLQQDLTFSMLTNRAWICVFVVYFIIYFIYAHTNRGVMDEQKAIENCVFLFYMPGTFAKKWRKRGKDSRSSSRKLGWWRVVTVVGREGRERGSENETDKQWRYPTVLCQPFPLHPYCIPSSWKLHIFISKFPLLINFMAVPQQSQFVWTSLLHKRLRLASAAHLIMKNSHAEVDLFCYESTYFIDVCR